MTILGCDKIRYKKKISHYFIIIASAAAAVIALNVLLAVFRTDDTHTAFVVINILSDIIAAWSVYAIVMSAVVPKKRLLSLYERGEKHGKRFTGRVSDLSDRTTCVQGFPCLKVAFDGEGAQRELYLIENGITLVPGKIYELSAVENLICTAEEIE